MKMNQDTINLLNDIELLYTGALNYIVENNIVDLQVTEAKNRLRAYIQEQSDIKPLYEYKLKNNTNGKYLAAGLKAEGKKGKTWEEKRYLTSAITTWINDVYIWYTLQPKTMQTIKVNEDGIRSYPYTDAAIGWHKIRNTARDDKEYRAQFIPDSWVVVAIPMNTKGDIKEYNAREFYLNPNL
jgi:hypothetical protein